MDDNPYAPPSAAAQASQAVAVDTTLEVRRRDRVEVERQIFFVGSFLFASGITQASVLPDWITHATRADAPFLFLHVLSMGCRLSAGVLLWRLAPLGRWLHLVAWIVVLSEHVLGTREPKAIVAVVCGGLVVGAVLWRAEARVVFEPDYRDAVVMGMRVNRPKPLFWLAHVLLVLIAGLVVFRNLPGHF